MFRFTIREVVAFTVVVAMCVAWWRDHYQLRSRLDLQGQQIRVLQRDLDHARELGSPVAMQSPFRNPEEAIEFFKSCRTVSDWQKVGGWDAFACSSVADEAVGPLTKMVAELPCDDTTRQLMISLIGDIGRKKRPLLNDPVPDLIALLNHPTQSTRLHAIGSLASFGSLAQTALPRLRQIMQRDLRVESLQATRAVKEINPSEEIGPQLRAFYFSKEQDLRALSALYIAKYLPPAEAKQFLTAQYERTTDRIPREGIAEAMATIKE